MAFSTNRPDSLDGVAFRNLTHMTYGWDPTGSASVRSAATPIQSLTAGHYWLPEGTYLVGATTSVASGVFLWGPGKLKPASGTTLTLAETPMAGPWQIFDLSAGGTVRITNTQEIWANWFASSVTAAAIQAAIDLVQSNDRGMVRLPSGVINIDTTLTFTNARSVQMVGMGFGHHTVLSGTILKWTGSANGTMIALDGVSQCRFAQFTLDGNSKSAAIGIYETVGSVTQSSMNHYEQVEWVQLQTGIKFGDLAANESQNDQNTFMKCWWRDNRVGVDICGDQSVHHAFYGCQFLNHNYNDGVDNIGAAIRTAGGAKTVGSGSGSPNGGGIACYECYWGDNDIDLDTPRFSQPAFISGRSEGARVVMNHSSNSGTVGRGIVFCAFVQVSAHASATYSVDFDTANDLLMLGCRFVQPILVDNQVAATAPNRTFINTEATITRSSTQPYYFSRIGSGAGQLDEKLYVTGNALVHGCGAAFTVADTDSAAVASATDITGMLVVRQIASDYAGLFMVSGGAVTEVSDPNSAFSTTAAAAGTTNVYVSGGSVRVENQTGSSKSYRVALVGADAT
jgi:hypothetical protein